MTWPSNLMILTLATKEKLKTIFIKTEAYALSIKKQIEIKEGKDGGDSTQNL